MTVLNSDTYKKNIQLVSDYFPYLNLLKDKSILITGCNGLICSAIVDILIYLNEYKNLNLKVFLATRNRKATEERFLVWQNKYLIPVEYDATKELCCDESFDYLIHGASNAFPSSIGNYPVETLYANVYGIEQILKHAKKYGGRVLYISSSEVYGELENQVDPIPENKYGYIDILNPRSSYSCGKRAAETLCSSYISEYGVDCVIARPGHIYGPTASEKDNRVSSQFMYSAAKGKNLILKSLGQQIRSYTHCLDCATAILTILLKGISGEAYNISNPDSICSIKTVAENFVKAGNVKLEFDLPTENEKNNFNPMVNSSLNSDKLQLLGWKAYFNIQTGINDTMRTIKELSCCNN